MSILDKFKQKKGKKKKAPIRYAPPRIITVSFTNSAVQLGNSGNFGKKITCRGLPLDEMPFDPTLFGVLTAHTKIPSFDYTFGENSPSLSILGEIKINELRAKN